MDLFSKYTLNNHTNPIIFNETYSSIYNGSNLDNFLESTVYNGFVTDVRNALNHMNVDLYGYGETILQRHIIAPSCIELGCSRDSSSSNTIYPIFSPYNSTNAKAIYYSPDGNYDTWYWTRDRTFNDVYSMDGGDSSSCNPRNGRNVVARIRFAKV